MSKLALSVAVGNYDRVRALMDGAVQIDGVDPVFMNLPPEEIFFRAFRSMDFDICELSMSSFAVRTAERSCPYVGVPAFVSRAFRHNSIYVRTGRIKTPEDLKGKRVGLPEYQLTACVWARIILEEQHGAKPSDIIWVRGGIEHPGRSIDSALYFSKIASSPILLPMIEIKRPRATAEEMRGVLQAVGQRGLRQARIASRNQGAERPRPVRRENLRQGTPTSARSGRPGRGREFHPKVSRARL